MAKNNVRAIAAKIVSRLLDGSGSLSHHLTNVSDHPDQSLLYEICFGVCRWFYTLEFLADRLLEKPLKAKDRDLFCLLIIGLYQLRELSIPQHAVLNETVSAAQELKKPWAKALVNAVLRNYLREEEVLITALKSAPEHVQHAFPEWLYSNLLEAWPENGRATIANSNLRPPMTLRINESRTDREEYLQLLAQAEIPAKPGVHAKTAIYLDSPLPVADIPGFSDGLASVQDEASQLAIAELQLQPGMRVLDACAAPGGKTCHILESERSLTHVTAVEISSQRIERIHENLARLDLTCEVICADVADLDNWWDRQNYDRILIDAPCSATGVIRRHPDVKLLRNEDEILQLRKLQQQILQQLWNCLKPNGLLLYTTCSLLPEENTAQIEQFLDATDNAKYEGITADWGVECRYGRQLLTGAKDGPDGFFYSLLRKV